MVPRKNGHMKNYIINLVIIRLYISFIAINLFCLDDIFEGARERERERPIRAPRGRERKKERKREIKREMERERERKLLTYCTN